MRTLSRPMFNMGGPIKQGIMHGIRESYRGGQLVQPGPGRPGYQGKIPKGKLGWAGKVASWFPGGAKLVSKIKTGSKDILPHWSKLNPFKIPKPSGNINPAAWKAATTPGITGSGAAQQFMRNLKSFSFPGSAKALDFAKRAVTYPLRKPKTTALTALYGGKPLYELATGPGKKLVETVADVAVPDWIYNWETGKWFNPDDKDTGTATNVPLNPALQATIKAAKELSNEKKNEFALQQRNDRVEKYLKMMGYDRAKKTAIADALIDASKIVGDRGTLDLKNIGRDLINPIIQATSKRLDKPEQIREAVGLMSVKAAIEKDLEDPSIKAIRLEQLKDLKGGFEQDLGEFILSAKGGKVKQEALEQFARVKAKKYGETFTVVDEGTTIPEGGSGYYMIEDKIFRVVDGTPQQVV